MVIRLDSLRAKARLLKDGTYVISSVVHFLIGLSWSLKFVKALAESLITGLRTVLRFVYISNPLPFSKQRKFDMF